MLKEGGNTKSVAPQVGPDIDEIFGEDSDREIKMDKFG